MDELPCEVLIYHRYCQGLFRLTAQDVKFELSQRPNQKTLAGYNLYYLSSNICLACLEANQRRTAFPYRPHPRVPVAAGCTLA